ncbi:hypothetical protein HNQ93_003333 [Hymenobacter luteus]|uniref:Uncharacterized protein n=2 Tax=Hymenobacter TaxID=89966 RepID=A0A7W9WC37_9BACT|nr:MULTISPECIES: hypothetical protein [Hymenobacter]MBB4602568.1 hypothetical protein [Hymenobacter latericoloratus]MBB6060459.1 hypothetical protein [Hymenobacter luteus]
MRPKIRRLWQFHRFSEKPGATMYAYRLTSQYDYDDKLQREVATHDTVEVAVTASQADSLFNLAKAVYKSVAVSNIDTIYNEPKQTHFETDDVSGILNIKSKYGNIRIDVGPLHSSNNRQVAPFLALCSRFKVLFPKEE